MLGIGPEFAEYYLILQFRSPSPPRSRWAFSSSASSSAICTGRPLETLLSTWGLSLILIQVVRVVFGAQT